MVSAGNVSHWAALIYGAAGIDRPALVIAVGHEVKGGRYRQTGGERRDKTRGEGYSTESWTKHPWPLRIISGLCFAAIETHKRLKMNAVFLKIWTRQKNVQIFGKYRINNKSKGRLALV